MNRTARTVTALGAATLMSLAGAGTASAQGSSDSPLPNLGSIARLLGAALPGAAPASPVSDPAPSTAPTSPSPAPTSPTTSSPAAPAGTVNEQAFAGRLVAVVNQSRSGVGAPTLTTDPALQSSASGHAAEMARTGRLTSDLHGPAGLKGFGWNAVALTPTAKPEEVVAFVMADTTRRQTMLDHSYTHVGAGVSTGADGNVYIVVEYGRR